MSSILKGIVNEGISAQDLADVLYNRLTMRYPDVVSRYGHEVVGDIISDVASFHEGAEELGTSDIGGMIRQIIRKLENYNIDEAVDPAQQTVYAQVKGLVDQLDKRGKQNVSKALKKNLGIVTEEDEVNYDDKYQSMVKRVGQMAKEGPRKTVWDPVKKVYKTVPAGQPKTDDNFQAYLAQRRAAKQGLGEGWKEETAEHDEFLQHARQQLQNASVMERIRLAQRLSKLEQKHFPEMFSSESNGISSSIFGMLQNVIDSSPRPNQQFGNVVTTQGTGSSEPLRPEPISARPSGATTSFAEPDDELEQEQDFFTWYQSASAEQQAELQQDIASEENMSPEEAKEYIEYMVQNGKIEPEEWKQKYANTVDEGFDPIRPLDLKHWAQKVKMYYPDAQIISAKMPGGPSIAKSGGVQVGSFDPSKGTSKIIRPQGVSSISAGSTMEEGVAEGESNGTAISLSKLGKFHSGADTLAEFVPERATAKYALHPDKWESTFYSLTNKDSDKLKYYGPKKISIPPGTLVGDMAIANKFYRAKTPEEQEQYAELYKQSLRPYPVDVSKYRMPELLITKQGVAEGSLNEFAPDGFNDGEDQFDPGTAQDAYDDGVRKGVSLSDNVDLARAMAINYWHMRNNGLYKQYFAKGFKVGREDKIQWANTNYGTNLKLMKDGSIRRDEQGVAEEKIKGADGKACWPGHRYNGTENGKDSCVKVKETKSNILKGLMG